MCANLPSPREAGVQSGVSQLGPLDQLIECDLRFRRPGYLLAQARGFATPPHDGCAFSINRMTRYVETRTRPEPPNTT